MRALPMHLRRFSLDLPGNSMTAEALTQIPANSAVTVPVVPSTDLSVLADHNQQPAEVSHDRQPAKVSHRRRRMILAVAVQAAVTVVAASIVFSLTLGPAAIWLLAWCVLDLFLAVTTSMGAGMRAVRAPLLTALVMTGVVAFIAAFTSADDIVPMVTIADENRYIFLIGLGSTVCITVLIRACLPALLPKRRLRIVTESEERTDGAVSDLVIEPSSESNVESFANLILAEVKRRGIEVVELTFQLDAEMLRQLSWALRGTEVEIYLPVVDLGIDPARVKTLSGVDSSGLLIGPSRPRLLQRAAKRFFDVALASLLAVVFSPLLVVVSITIKVFMPGPVFYTQTRIGLDGKPFQIIKFRSMIVNADAQLNDLLTTQGNGTQPLFKVESDPRITRLGQTLRRSSIDELPQLFNVIGGSMSLVGPRPQRDGEVALYKGTDHHRLGVRPGMTGLWQVSGRSDLKWDEAREFDLYYAHNWNLKNDLKILFQTFGAVVRAAGAQ
ncbi:sugar transferase [Brevibacterium linens]|nr:sugar transferase [Brevibacterium linens]